MFLLRKKHADKSTEEKKYERGKFEDLNFEKGKKKQQNSHTIAWKKIESLSVSKEKSNSNQK